MWALVAIETVYGHLFVISALGICYCLFWASVCSIPLLTSAISMQTFLFCFAWWAMDGIVDFRVVFQTSQQQRKWELLAAAEGENMSIIPKFILDLDTHPSERWNHIVRPYIERGEVERMKAFMVGQLIHEYGKVGAIILSLIARVIITAHARFSMPPEYREELLGISKLTSRFGLFYFDLLQLNYGGDFVANCTSAVVRCCDKGSPVHLRNMDWFPQQSLRPLTVRA